MEMSTASILMAVVSLMVMLLPLIMNRSRLLLQEEEWSVETAALPLVRMHLVVNTLAIPSQ